MGKAQSWTLSRGQVIVEKYWLADDPNRISVEASKFIESIRTYINTDEMRAFSKMDDEFVTMNASSNKAMIDSFN